MSTTSITSTATRSVETSALSRRPNRRRLSTSFAHNINIRSSCQPLSLSIAALDLPSASPAPVLASLRIQVLSYLADLEARLSLLESPISAESMKVKGETTVEDARLKARTALEMLYRIRTDVCSHLPEWHFEAVPSVEEFVKSHIPDVRRLDDVRAHLPTMPDSVRSRLPELAMPDMRSRLDDVRSRISDIDFHRPLEYIPTLYEHLLSLQAHISSTELPQSISESVSLLTPSAKLFELVDKVMSSEFIHDFSSDVRQQEDRLEKAAVEIAKAVKHSLNGSRLIQYVDLPEKWKNNPFVARGYRFIPLRQWPLLLMSLFALHNETVNIHTHLIPFVLWSLNLIPVTPFWTTSVSSSDSDFPGTAFGAFALLCLFTSALWHTMAGCAHPKGMELCARVDYVGIGWLISASVGTVVWYGFQCNPSACQMFLVLCVLMGISGTVLPFTPWFDSREYRGYRIAFFVALALSATAPLAHLAKLHSTSEMFAFMAPLVPSLLSYIAGLVFYATHFPECIVVRPSGRPHWLDWLGGGSHAIWHVCVVCAISLHRSAMDEMKNGIGSMVDDVCAMTLR